MHVDDDDITKNEMNFGRHACQTDGMANENKVRVLVFQPRQFRPRGRSPSPELACVRSRSPPPARGPYQRLQGTPAPLGTGSSSNNTSWAQAGQSQAGHHAAMPVPCRIGMGAHSSPHGRKAVAAQHLDAWWRRGSGASVEVNVRSQ